MNKRTLSWQTHTITWLFALCAVLVGTLSTHASIVNDPFIRQNTDRSNFEPGGQYHLFGSRGSLAEQTGSINIVPAGELRAGNLLLEQATIQGNIGYQLKFANHGHKVHAPFDNHDSRSKSDKQSQALMGFTSYQLSWTGSEHHPADGYDGEQGGGHPVPTGARDEYTYTVKGDATSVNIVYDDDRSTSQRLDDRLKDAKDSLDAIAGDWERATTHNPELSRFGNAAEFAGAIASGIGNFTGAGWNAIGINDAFDGVGLARDVALLEGMRALPPSAQFDAVNGTLQANNAYNHATNAYNNWAAANPNAAAAVGAGYQAVDAMVGRGGKSKVEAAGDTPPRTSFRQGTLKNAWDNAADGSQPNTKKCPTCGVDVTGNPYSKEKRNTTTGWDGSHNPSWSNRQHSSERKEQLDDYNRGVSLECRSCNRSGGNRDGRFDE
ncbi:MAG: MafB family polymorphic toxin [Moraxella sp.]|nr:MafB family polymorphic toxin [Moraxella sp.]